MSQGGRNTPHAHKWIEVMKSTGTFFGQTIYDKPIFVKK